MASAKNIQFYALLGVLGAAGAFLAGASYFQYDDYKRAREALRRADGAVAGMLTGAALDAGGQPVALTEQNVAAAKADLAALQAQQTALRNAIAGEPENQIRSDFNGIANELGTLIQQDVYRWRREAGSKDIRLPKDEICFGFRRYIRNPGTQPPRLYREVDRQRQIIDFLFKSVLEARSAGGPLLLLSIDREPIETYPGPAAGTPDTQAFTIDTPDAATLASKPQPDEFILSGHSFRRPGLVGSLAFRIRFVGKTDALRVLLNTIQNTRKPLVVSAVDIFTLSEETKRDLADVSRGLSVAAAPPGFAPAPAFAPTPGFGALGPAVGSAEAAPKAERQLVVRESLSEFVVHLEYIFPADGK